MVPAPPNPALAGAEHPPPISHGNRAGGSVPFGTGGGGTGSRDGLLAPAQVTNEPRREVQGRSHSGARCSEAFPPVQSELSSKKNQKTNQKRIKSKKNERKSKQRI